MSKTEFSFPEKVKRVRSDKIDQCYKANGHWEDMEVTMENSAELENTLVRDRG